MTVGYAFRTFLIGYIFKAGDLEIVIQENIIFYHEGREENEGFGFFLHELQAGLSKLAVLYPLYFPSLWIIWFIGCADAGGASSAIDALRSSAHPMNFIFL